MSSILVLPRSFSTTLTQVSKGSLVQSVAPNIFTTIQMNSIDSDVGGNWDAGTNHYIVPSTGLYQVTGTLRSDDTLAQGTPFGVGVHSSNTDGSWFLWHSVQRSLGGFQRTTYPYIRTGFFSTGQRLRMFTFSDLNFGVGASVLNIFRVA